jgi:hypothetical protein
MNELEVLTDRMHELGRRAPVPAGDPLLDVRRGRVALRRRHARSAAGITTALVAVGTVAANVGSLSWPGGPNATEVPIGSPSGGNALASVSTGPATTTTNACSITVSEGASVGPTRSAGTPAIDHDLALARTPEANAAMSAYRDAATAILDPSGNHLDSRSNRRSDDVQPGVSCDPRTGDYLTSLGTSIGWTGGGALGVVKLEVASPQQDQKPEIVLDHDGWAKYTAQLPAGVVRARVTTFTEDGGGQAVVVTRTDGLTVAVATSGRWGNNVAPDSPSATDLPTVDRLLALAASPRLTMPDPAPR